MEDIDGFMVATGLARVGAMGKCNESGMKACLQYRGGNCERWGMRMLCRWRMDCARGRKRRCPPIGSGGLSGVVEVAGATCA